MHKFRVFVSYSSEDLALAEKLVQTLNVNGFHVLWSRNIQPGVAFTDEIKGMSARSQASLTP